MSIEANSLEKKNVTPNRINHKQNEQNRSLWNTICLCCTIRTWLQLALFSAALIFFPLPENKEKITFGYDLLVETALDTQHIA